MRVLSINQEERIHSILSFGATWRYFLIVYFKKNNKHIKLIYYILSILFYWISCKGGKNRETWGKKYFFKCTYMLQVIAWWSYLLIWMVYFFWLFVFPWLDYIESLALWVWITTAHISYISAIIAFITLLWIFQILENQLRNILRKIFVEYGSEIAELFVDKVLNVIRAWKYLLALYAGVQIAIIPEKFEDIASQIIWVLVSVLILYLITQAIKIFFEKKIQDAEKIPMVNASILPFLKKVFLVWVWVIGLISIASNLWYNVTWLLAWAWVLGIWVWLAAQKSIANIFWALTIFLNKPFVVWDFVKIGAHIGSVQEISLTYITLSDATWHDVMIPNETILSSSVENYTKRWSRRSDFSIGVVYDTSVKKMKQAISIIEDILKEYEDKEIVTSYRVNFDTFWDFSLNINATYFTSTLDFTEFLKEREAINLEIKTRYEKAWISMAFPTQEVIVKK